MICVISAANGKTVKPSMLQEWSVQYTDGTSCDSFRVRFAATAAQCSTLRRAAAVRLYDTETRFLGIVDECQLEVGEAGRFATLTGRGYMARLMDNEVGAAQYYTVSCAQILNTYVKPYGITQITADELPPVGWFAVPAGTTAWKVLCGFCRHSSGVQPRFLPDGRLCLQKKPAGKTVTLETGQILKLQERFTPYGAITKQTIVSAAGTLAVLENLPAERLGCLCQRVDTQTGNTLKATWYTAAQRIKESMRQLRQMDLTVSGAFAAQPGDTVVLSYAPLDVFVHLTVTEATTTCSADGITCRILAAWEG